MSLSFKRNYSGFSPKDFGPALWLDDTGSDASVWTDKSGFGRDATQINASEQPQIIPNALNGKQVRRFDGGDSLKTSSFNTASFVNGSTVFAVAYNADTDNSSYRPIVRVLPSGAIGLQRHGTADTSPGKLEGFVFNTSGAVYRGSPTSPPTISWRIAVALATQSTISTFYNGILVGGPTTIVGTIRTGNDQVFIGIEEYNLKFLGDIAEIIIYPRALTQFEKQVVEGYLSEKWGIPVSSSLAPSIRIGQSFDPDASSYFSRIEIAGSSITRENMIAIDQFIKGCKADGIWNAIKASCLLCGADTLAGALVPLVGTAPTNIGFVEADYNKKTGLRGNTASKRLDTNRLASADPINNAHIAVYTTQSAINRPCTLAGNSDLNYRIYLGSSGIITRMKSTEEWIPSSTAGNAFGLIGVTRDSLTQLVARFNNTTYVDTDNTAVQGPDQDIFIFGNGSNSADVPVTFYSLGGNIDLTKLNTRLDTLMLNIN